ncbi:MAG: RsmB/NOP family class I SAM-dependent RNA methyltransferase [Burkholderiaceae bacterium]|jgi:16S rRNA (cytosine967-C5)-methyltransferase|nr:RsmB/NOP family class I SAM-dependent RNA methyltransferase [Burkholderiaceae bacterium]
MPPKVLLDTATDLVQRVLRLDTAADAAVAGFFRERRALGPRERATLAETVYAVLRRKLLFDYLACSSNGAHERRLAMLGFAAPRDFLRPALTADEQAWLAACDAVLEDVNKPATSTNLPPACRHNLPPWLAERLQAELGEPEFDALAAALLQSAPLDLRVNTLLTKRAQAEQELRAAGIAATPTPHSPWGLRVSGKPALNRLGLFTRGAIEVQDEGAQLLALLLDARRGEMAADFCAGAGGKTLAIGAAMRDTGRLYAFDVSAHRLAALGPRLARSGLSNVYPIVIAHERDERVARLGAKLDRVLVDAPCSGLGTLRRNPDLKWRQSPQDVRELALRQQAILSSAARLVKPGGRLVYATCSLLADENEAVAGAFSAAHPNFAPLHAAELLHALKVPDATSLVTARGHLRLWPHQHGTDGFFAAVWQRLGS